MEQNTSQNDSVKRILIAEDNDSNYMLVRHILKGYELVHVINGVEAVKIMKEQDFDMILMDMKMPEMDGLEATRRIREFNPIIPIIAVTANAFDSDKMNALEAGCNEFVTKPLRKADLLNVVEKY